MKRIAAAALFLFFVVAPVFGAAVPVQFLLTSFLDNDQQPNAGGHVYFYSPGGTSQKTVWQNSTMATAYTQPVVLDIYGRKAVYASGTYRVRVYDASESTILADYDNMEFISQQTPNTLVVTNLTAATATLNIAYIPALIGVGTFSGVIQDTALSNCTVATYPAAATQISNKAYVDVTVATLSTTVTAAYTAADASLTLAIAAGDASNTAEMIAYDASQTLAIASLSASIVAVTGEMQYVEAVATLTALSAAPTLATLTYFIIPASFTAGWYDVGVNVTAYGQSVATAPSGVQYWVGHLGAAVSTTSVTLWSPIFGVSALDGPSTDCHFVMYLSPAQLVSLLATSVSATGIAAQSDYARLSARYLGATKRAP